MSIHFFRQPTLKSSRNILPTQAPEPEPLPRTYWDSIVTQTDEYNISITFGDKVKMWTAVNIMISLFYTAYLIEKNKFMSSYLILFLYPTLSVFDLINDYRSISHSNQSQAQSVNQIV